MRGNVEELMVFGPDIDHEKVAGTETILALIRDPVPGDPMTRVHGRSF